MIVARAGQLHRNRPGAKAPSLLYSRNSHATSIPSLSLTIATLAIGIGISGAALAQSTGLLRRRSRAQPPSRAPPSQ
ncbi:MAG: hypothetical protein H0W40_07655 [Methylibium sp.]|uniref:hypothetical protein n=1 Tax=Methylibium sp. TaxID=2067992 RepID=UPI0017B2FF5D|nr:hypothetical protein [Methylibium sp.]MBA3597237.1 hypothetical protein [Methylibium sp.]